MFHHTLFACLFLSVTMTMSTTASGQETESAAPPSAVYTHLLYSRMLERAGALKGELALHKLPGDLMDLTLLADPARKVCDWQGSFSGIFGVHRGKIYGSMGSASVVIDVQSGQEQKIAGYVQLIAPCPKHDMMLVSTPSWTVVHKVSLKSLERSVLLRGSNKRPSMPGSPHSRITVSPNGDRAAIATYVSGQFDPLAHSFEIHIVDLTIDPPRIERFPQTFIGGHVSTGGGDHAMAPAMFWKDDRTLLLAAGETSQFKKGIAGSSFDSGKPSLMLYSADLSGDFHPGMVSAICPLPIPVFTMMNMCFDPDFWRRSDGAIMIRSRGRGDLRIDLIKKVVVKDRRLTRDYRLQGDVYRPSLHYKGELLAEKVNLMDISLSPDGRRIAWLIPNQNNASAWSTTTTPKTLWLHSAESGTLPIASGRFGGRGCLPSNPIRYPSIRWLTSADLTSD